MDHLSPRRIQKNRRSGFSDYYSAAEEEDSDNSLYLSCTDIDKENSIRESSANRPKNEAPLHKRLLQNFLKNSTLTPKNKNNKRVSFNIGAGHWNVSEQVAKMQITGIIKTNEIEQTDADSSQSENLDDEHDTTVVAIEALIEPETSELASGIICGEAATLKPEIESAASAMPTLQIPDPPQVIVTNPNGEDVVKNVLNKIRLSQKRMSTVKPANVNSVANAQRIRLANEMNKRATVGRKSSICQPRRTAVRRSIEKIKRLREKKLTQGMFNRFKIIICHLVISKCIFRSKFRKW